MQTFNSLSVPVKTHREHSLFHTRTSLVRRPLGVKNTVVGAFKEIKKNLLNKFDMEITSFVCKYFNLVAVSQCNGAYISYHSQYSHA